jgi:2-isopropylmalate synthase
MISNRRVLLFDSTLRDGLQGEPTTLTLDDRLNLFDLIENTGVDYIETGFPAASAVDFELTKILSHKKKRPKLSLLARPTEQELALTMSALPNKENVQVQLMFTGSEIHLEKKRRISFAENIREMERGIDLLKSYGIADITAGFEDASRGSIEFLKRCIDVCVRRGATTMALPDTMGTFIPDECYEFVSAIRAFVKNDAQLSMHAHNDMGLATANSLAAVKAGIDCVQGTFCGIGERAGNAALEEIACALHYKQTFYRTACNMKLDALHPLYLRMKELLRLPPSIHKPIFGDHAFATSAGLHISGILKDRSTYEYVNPELFGRSWRLLINGNLGKAVVVHKLKQLGVEPREEAIGPMVSEIKASKDPAEYNDDDKFLALYREKLGASA